MKHLALVVVLQQGDQTNCLMSWYVQKFISEQRPDVLSVLNQRWYSASMNAVSSVMWRSGEHAQLCREQDTFMRTDEGRKYYDALSAEIDVFREVLRQRK